MPKLYTLITADAENTSSTALAERHHTHSLDLHDELPPLFARSLEGFLGEDHEPLATVFVDSEAVLERHTPARALVLTADGVLFMEAGEAIIGETPWGVNSLFYPYTQISAVGLGSALLMGRFTLHGRGSAPICEISVPSEDLPQFEAVTQWIREKIAS